LWGGTRARASRMEISPSATRWARRSRSLLTAPEIRFTLPIGGAMNGPALRAPTGSGAPTRFCLGSPLGPHTLTPHHTSPHSRSGSQTRPGGGKEQIALDRSAGPSYNSPREPPGRIGAPSRKRLGRRFIVCGVCPASRSAQPLPRRPSPARGQQAIAPCGQQAIASAPRAVTAHPRLPHLPRRAQDPARCAQPDPAEAKEKNVPLIGRP
jgi:hypothetical protein